MRREYIFWGKITNCNPTPFQYWLTQQKVRLHGLIKGHKVKEFSRIYGNGVDQNSRKSWWGCCNCEYGNLFK